MRIRPGKNTIIISLVETIIKITIMTNKTGKDYKKGRNKPKKPKKHVIKGDKLKIKPKQKPKPKVQIMGRIKS